MIKKVLKYFIGYKDDEKVKPLCVECFQKRVNMQNSPKLFSKIIKKGFDSKPVYNAKYRKTKTKSYIGTINTNFL